MLNLTKVINGKVKSVWRFWGNCAWRFFEVKLIMMNILWTNHLNNSERLGKSSDKKHTHSDRVQAHFTIDEGEGNLAEKSWKSKSSAGVTSVLGFWTHEGVPSENLSELQAKGNSTSKGELHKQRGTPRENELHILVRVWAGESRCDENFSDQFSFVSGNIDQHDAAWWRNGISNWSRDLSSQSRHVHDRPRAEVTWPVWDPILSSGCVMLVVFLANKRELVGKSFTTPLTSLNLTHMHMWNSFSRGVPLN